MTTQISGTTGVSKVQDGVVVQADLAAPAYLPTPQTWQDVKASRTHATDYTNSTGQPIVVSVSILGTSVVDSTFSVNGLAVSVQTSTTTTRNQHCVTVPAGATYRVSNGNVAYWTELR